MRYRIAREGIDTVLGTRFEPGSLKWSDEPLMVTWGNRFDVDNVIGKATDLRRDEEGWITAEVEWNEKASPVMTNLIDKDVYMTLYATQIIEDARTQPNDLRVVKSATIKILFVTLTVNPWKEKL